MQVTQKDLHSWINEIFVFAKYPNVLKKLDVPVNADFYRKGVKEYLLYLVETNSKFIDIVLEDINLSKYPSKEEVFSRFSSAFGIREYHPYNNFNYQFFLETKKKNFLIAEKYFPLEEIIEKRYSNIDFETQRGQGIYPLISSEDLILKPNQEDVDKFIQAALDITNTKVKGFFSKKNKIDFFLGFTMSWICQGLLKIDVEKLLSQKFGDKPFDNFVKITNKGKLLNNFIFDEQNMIISSLCNATDNKSIDDVLLLKALAVWRNVDSFYNQDELLIKWAKKYRAESLKDKPKNVIEMEGLALAYALSNEGNEEFIVASSENRDSLRERVEKFVEEFDISLETFKNAPKKMQSSLLLKQIFNRKYQNIDALLYSMEVEEYKGREILIFNLNIQNFKENFYFEEKNWGQVFGINSSFGNERYMTKKFHPIKGDKVVLLGQRCHADFQVCFDKNSVSFENSDIFMKNVIAYMDGWLRDKDKDSFAMTSFEDFNRVETLKVVLNSKSKVKKSITKI